LYSLANTVFHLYVVLNPRFVVGILTVTFIVSEIEVFPASAAISDGRSLLDRDVPETFQAETETRPETHRSET